MAVTAGTPTVIINNFNVFEAIVPLTASGSYPGTSAGDTLSLIGIVPSNSVPIFVTIDEEPPEGTLASGLLFRFAPGTTQANGAMQVFQSGSSGQANLGNVTYASVAVANLVARVVYKKFV